MRSASSLSWLLNPASLVMSMLLCSDTVLWSIIGDAGLFVRSVVPSAQVPLSFHILTGNMGSRPVLAEQRTPKPPLLLAPPREATSSDAIQVDDGSQDVVLDYCAAVRGIHNDDQGGPLHPPGLRMAEALADVHASLQRNVAAQKGGRRTSTVPV